jgi:hypothetical protein
MSLMPTGLFVGAQHAASFVRELWSAVREVNEWRNERDAFVATYLDERRRARPAPGLRAKS